MDNISLKQKCYVNSNYEGDTFVGIKGEDGDIKICFPLGYRIGKDDKTARKDILNLIGVLSTFTDRKEGRHPLDNRFLVNMVQFPIVAYMKVIHNYLNSGYYHENEIRYKNAKRGKINWARTIKTQRAYPQENEVLYFNFVVKENTINNDEMISLIHEYCVYESFQKLGWLYTTHMPRKPRIKFNKPLFLSIIYEKLGQTYNDKNKELFQSMLDMINSMGTDGCVDRFYFGTDRFEYVWEKLIDHVFGVNDKERYFPRTSWHLLYGNKKDNNALEPDTIMVAGNNIYVLDAKYYKYGSTGNPGHLPESTSINKQITYGKYIANNKMLIKEYGEEMNVYNSFIMPFSKEFKYFSTDDNYKHIGEATGDWKEPVGAEYEHVQGILLDVKYIMYNHMEQNENEIQKLATLIEQSYEHCKKCYQS